MGGRRSGAEVETVAALVQEARVTRIPRQRGTTSLHRSASRAGGKKRGRNWHGLFAAFADMIFYSQFFSERHFIVMMI